MVQLLQLSADPERIPEMARYLAHRTGDGAIATARTGPDRLVVWVSAPTPELCRSVFEAGGACTTCPFLPGENEGPEVVGVLLPERSGARAGRPAPAAVGELIRIGRYRGPRQLSVRQARALEVAYRLGYLGHPRRADLADVAKALGIGRSAAMELLRRAIVKLAEDHLRQELPASGLV